MDCGAQLFRLLQCSAQPFSTAALQFCILATAVLNPCNCCHCRRRATLSASATAALYYSCDCCARPWRLLPLQHSTLIDCCTAALYTCNCCAQPLQLLKLQPSTLLAAANTEQGGHKGCLPQGGHKGYLPHNCHLHRCAQAPQRETSGCAQLQQFVASRQSTPKRQSWRFWPMNQILHCRQQIDMQKFQIAWDLPSQAGSGRDHCMVMPPSMV